MTDDLIYIYIYIYIYEIIIIIIIIIIIMNFYWVPRLLWLSHLFEPRKSWFL